MILNSTDIIDCGIACCLLAVCCSLMGIFLTTFHARKLVKLFASNSALRFMIAQKLDGLGKLRF